MKSSGRVWQVLCAAISLAISMRAALGNQPAKASPDAGLAANQNGATAVRIDEGAAVSSDTLKVMFVPVRGEYGRGWDVRPFKRALKHAKDAQADITVLVIDSAIEPSGTTRDEWLASAADLAWSGTSMYAASEMSLMWRDAVREDAAWKTRSGKKPRVVAWVKKAIGPSSALALGCGEIYMHPKAKLGPGGPLDWSSISQHAQPGFERRFTLRQGRFEGIMASGGYLVGLARFMCRSGMIGSADFQNGRVVIRDDLAGEAILADGGDKHRQDSLEQLKAFEGNDTLILRPELATRLGVNKGTVATEQELADALGIKGKYVLMTKDAEAVFAAWATEIDDVRARVGALWAEHNALPGNVGSVPDRLAAAEKRLAVLKKIRGLRNEYGIVVAAQQYPDATSDWADRLDGWISFYEAERSRIK